MKAIVHRSYGSPDALELVDVPLPAVADTDVLVEVRAASLNPLDWHTLTGTPYLVRTQCGLRRPRTGRVGVDFAGVVTEVGSRVTDFHPGDEVYGARTGALAEYVCRAADGALAPKPSGLTFEQAAAVPVAALTALQGLRDKGRVAPGQRVLVNGASGGVGTFAVQIAKSLGADVTGVCSTRNVELVRALGAQDVIDYTHDDFARGQQRYDLILDIAGNRAWSDCKRVLEPRGTVVIVGGPKRNRLIGPLGHMLGMRVASLGSGHKVTFFLAQVNKADLVALGELLAAGTVTPVVDRRYELADIADAFRYLGEGHTQGKVVVSI